MFKSHRQSYTISAAIIILLLNISVIKDAEAQDQQSRLIGKYKSYLLNNTATPVADSVTKWSENLGAANTWADIDYANNDPANWQARKHLIRVQFMALAWADPKSKLYNSSTILSSFNRALDNWLQKRYQNGNWWHNEIGIPQVMRDILVLTYQTLTKERLNGALSVLHQYKVKGIGANLVWTADLAMHYAALTDQPDSIGRMSALIANEIKVSAGDGIQPDNSYHQHGERLQTYHYGSAFIKDNVRLAWELSGTPWAFPDTKIDILVNCVTEGWQWMARGIYTVPGTIDRAVSRKGILKAANLTESLPLLIELKPQKAKTFKAMQLSQLHGKNKLSGYRYYPYSDFAVYHQPQYSFFVKTISTRTLTTENINGENQKGRLLNAGNTYFIKDGNEYFDLMPVWDWEALPGITNAAFKGNIIRTPYSGGLSNGQSGITAIDYVLGKDKQSVKAHKSWFSYRGIVVALIANLKSEGINGQLYTVLDQSRWRGDIIVGAANTQTINQAGSYIYEDAAYLWHNGFAYIPVGRSKIQLKLKDTSGSWKTISTSEPEKFYNNKVFLPLLLHAPNASSAAYMVAPCKNYTEAAALAKAPGWKILQSNGTVNAVAFSDGTVMAVFFNAGQINNKQLSVDKPCLLMIQNKMLFLSDPLHAGALVNVIYKAKKYTFQLPENGDTISQKL